MEERVATPGDGQNAMTMYYDGACPICSKEVATYRRLDRDNAVRWHDVSVSDGDLGLDGVSQSDALTILHARLPDGRLVKGVDAFIAVWERLPRFRLFARVARWRPVHWMLEKGYGWYAPRRKRLTRLLEPAARRAS